MKKEIMVLIGLALAAGSGFSQSAVDGFNPQMGSVVKTMACQADGKILVGGLFDQIGGVERRYIARLDVSGSLDLDFNPVAGNHVYTLAVQTDGKILVGGIFETLGNAPCYRLGRLNSNGSLDAGFSVALDDAVRSIVIQPDGKILAAGDFTLVNNSAVHNRIVRLNSDGSVDSSFNPPGGVNASVHALALQPDGKIVVGGLFTELAGDLRRNLGRLNRDGSLDSTFNPTDGANGQVSTLGLQSDGKIIVGGEFTELAGVARNYLGRLNADGGPDASFDVVINDNGASIKTVLVQPDDKILIGGDFLHLDGIARRCVGRLNADGSLDAGFNPAGGADCTVGALAIQSDGGLLVGGEFSQLAGVDRPFIGRLYPDGSLDDTFLDAAATPGLGASSTVYAMAQQPDGQLIVGGLFQQLSGVDRNRIGRFKVDGTLDAAFNPDADSSVRAVVVQSDGKILIGGFFTHLGVPAFNYLARLDSAGSPEAGFAPQLAGGGVRCIVPQPDGKIIVAGEFTQIGDTDCLRIGRLNSDGTLDAAFTVPEGADDIVYSALLQADGKIVLAGDFTHLGGVERNHIGRLNSDGSLDLTFDPNINNGSVYTLALQSDGKILLGGTFTAIGVDAADCKRIGRLNSDGTLDTSFVVPSGANLSVRSIAVQTDGKILVGGAFTQIGGLALTYVARLNTSGSVDTDYAPPGGANGTVHGLVLQADGKVIAGGDFTQLAGRTRNRIGRLTARAAALQNLAVNVSATEISWTRTGDGPEVDTVVFDQSPDNTTWSTLGAGSRLTNGWQIASLNLPFNTNLYLRARGFYRGSYFNGSVSLLESVRRVYLTPPIVDITNMSGIVAGPEDATFCALSGTANTNTAGNLVWTNSLLAAGGAFPAGTAWSITNVTLGAGTNILSVWGSNTVGGVATDTVSVVVRWSTPVTADFDGDHYADPAAYIGTNWYVWFSSAGYQGVGPFVGYGLEGAQGVPADFDGDGAGDPAVYQGTNWYVWFSSVGYAAGGPFSFGMDGAIPVPADFDGDRVSDPAVYQGTNWYVWFSSVSYTAGGPYNFGIAGAIPVPADFDGDHYADPAVYFNNAWYVWFSSAGYGIGGPYAFGAADAVPLAADFDGDGAADPAVSYNRQWLIWLSKSGYAPVGPLPFNLNP